MESNSPPPQIAGPELSEVVARLRPRNSLTPRPEHVQLALESSGTGLWTWDLPTDEVRWSSECHRIHGMSQDEVPLTGAEFFEWVHPLDRERVRDALQRALHERTLYEAEFRIVRPAGDCVWVSNRGRAVYDKEGIAQSVMGTIMDISARRSVAAAEKETEALHRALAEELPNGAAFVVDRSLRYRLAAGQALTASGLDPSGYRGKSVFDMVPPEAIEMVTSDYRRALAGSAFRREHMLHGREFVTHGIPLRQADGTIYSALAVSYDVTERAWAEKMLKVRERELQTLADNLPDMLIRFDRGMRHVFVNGAVERLLGRPAAAFLGRTSRELGMPEQVCLTWDKAVECVFEGKVPTIVELELETPAGHRQFQGRIVPEFEASGSVQYVLAIVTDMTGQRAAEAALIAAGHRKDEFLATLAHELRNPLAPLRTALEIMRRGRADPGKTLSALEVMDRQLTYLVRLVDDLMDAARIGQGKVVLERRHVVLQDVVDRAVELSRPLLEAAQHHFKVEVPPHPVTLNADATRVVQILSNLLNNAAKYTPTGGSVLLTVILADGQAVIRVSDNGVGVPAHMIAHVFDLFTQVEDHRDHAAGGLGIGLALVSRLAQLHGGSVEVQSVVGEGSTFTVRLPVSAS